MATIQPIPNDPRFKDLTGQQFGRLTVIRYVGKPSRYFLWLCRCSCGNEKIVHGGALRSGNTNSCGCYARQRASEAKTTHGYSSGTSRAYRIWREMKKRCSAHAGHNARLYYERGISICPRWLHSFKNFLADMGEPPTDKHSLDRYPNQDGNYEPDNCRWATPVEQGRNKRNNHLLTFRNQTKTITEWAEITGIKQAAIRKRLSVFGWTIEQALTIPSRKRLS